MVQAISKMFTVWEKPIQVLHLLLSKSLDNCCANSLTQKLDPNVWILWYVPMFVSLYLNNRPTYFEHADSFGKGHACVFVGRSRCSRISGVAFRIAPPIGG